MKEQLDVGGLRRSLLIRLLDAPEGRRSLLMRLLDAPEGRRSLLMLILYAPGGKKDIPPRLLKTAMRGLLQTCERRWTNISGSRRR